MAVQIEAPRQPRAAATEIGAFARLVRHARRPTAPRPTVMGACAILQCAQQQRLVCTATTPPVPVPVEMHALIPTDRCRIRVHVLVELPTVTPSRVCTVFLISTLDAEKHALSASTEAMPPMASVPTVQLVSTLTMPAT